jgi:uncharacterized protein (TIGR02391 family)
MISARTDLKSMKTLISVCPDPETILKFEPEEMAWVLLEVLQSRDDNLMRVRGNHYTFAQDELKTYPKEKRQALNQVLVEGWAWLQRECLLVSRPETEGEFVLSRRAKELATRAQMEAYRRANLLAGMLHPLIENESKSAFLRGDYGLAVLSAFKQVEVAVRAAGSFSWNDLGVDLMNNAFKPNVGPLTDTAIPEPEQLGLRSLFAGAIGYFKNPGSHRNVPTDPVEVAEILFFASLLLRIVDRAAALRKPTTP